MAKISVEIEAMIEEAKLIRDCTEDINNIIIKLTNGLNKLSESWKDSEFEKFTKINRDKVAQLKDTKEQFETIYNTLTAKVKVANDYLSLYKLSVDSSALTNTNNSSNVNPHTKETNKSNNQNSNSGESIVTGEKNYKPFGKYFGKLKGSENQSNDKKKCHDEKGKLTFRNNDVFIGKFEEDIPISGELTFHENKYLEKYIGDVKIDDKKFVSDGEGIIIFHKDKFKLKEFVNSDTKKEETITTIFEKNEYDNDLESYVSSYEGELNNEYLIHGEGIITVMGSIGYATDKFLSINIKSMNGKIIKRGVATQLKESKIDESKIGDFIESKINEWLPSAVLEIGIVAKPILSPESVKTIKEKELLDLMVNNSFGTFSKDVSDTLAKTSGKLGGAIIGGLVFGASFGKTIAGLGINQLFKMYFERMKDDEKKNYINKLLIKYKGMRENSEISDKKNEKYFIEDDKWNKIIWN